MADVKKQALFYCLWVISVVMISSVIGMSFPPDSWYASLNKPSFNPPGWVFGPVWMVLYVCIAVAGAKVHLVGSARQQLTWWLQMLLNWLWTPIFFGLHQLLLSGVVVLLLLLSIISFISVVWSNDRSSAYSFVPYFLWVSFAATLNWSIWWQN